MWQALNLTWVLLLKMTTFIIDVIRFTYISFWLQMCKSSVHSHACLEQLPMKKKFLRQVFNIFLLYCIPIYYDNWFWNQNQAKFWENAIFIFFNLKSCPILAGVEHFVPSNLIFLSFWIELMFPTDSQILVDDLRHQNFGIWTILGWVMAIYVKNMCKIIELLCKWTNYLILSRKEP